MSAQVLYCQSPIGELTLAAEDSAVTHLLFGHVSFPGVCPSAEAPGHAFSGKGVAGPPDNPLRGNPHLPGHSPAGRLSQGCPGRRLCQPSQPHFHLHPLPPGYRQKRIPHRIRRRASRQTLSAGTGKELGRTGIKNQAAQNAAWFHFFPDMPAGITPPFPRPSPGP